MEITCNRCHQAVLAENCYCPSCGLPQLVYVAEVGTGPAEQLSEIVRDAGSIDWKTGIRTALALAIPAGLLSSGVSPVSMFGLLWIAAAAAWAVVHYVRSQRPAWITASAGARIGLVTGLLAGWLAFGVSGGGLFVERVFLHRSNQIDSVYQTLLDTFNQKLQESMAGMTPSDAAQMQPGFTQIQLWLQSPEGHAGIWTISIISNCLFLVLFGVGGGALGARLLARSRRPEI